MVLASVVIDESAPLPPLPVKTGKKIWRDKDKKAEKAEKKSKRPPRGTGPSERFSISISGETHRAFKEATDARGTKMGPALEREVDRFFGIYRIEGKPQLLHFPGDKDLDPQGD